MDKKIKNYAVESLVILFSIILSFYIEGRRDLAEKNSNKNKLITDLINTIDEDLKQLDYIKSEMNRSSKIINEIQGDISSRKNILTEKQIIDKLTETNVSYSYFAQKGIFNQLIATGSFELIEKQELKLLLLKIYNHQNDRNNAISILIDNFSIDFLNQIYSKFRIDIDQNNMEGEIYGIKQLTNYQFNEEYYYSDDFFGLLTRAEIYVNNYSRLINDISKNLEQAKIYAEYEISNK